MALFTMEQRPTCVAGATRLMAQRSAPDSSAITTPRIAMTTPSDFRTVSASLPSAAPATMVSSGRVEGKPRPARPW
jgi:hypothetical protein